MRPLARYVMSTPPLHPYMLSSGSARVHATVSVECILQDRIVLLRGQLPSVHRHRLRQVHAAQHDGDRGRRDFRYGYDLDQSYHTGIIQLPDR